MRTLHIKDAITMRSALQVGCVRLSGGGITFMTPRRNVCVRSDHARALFRALMPFGGSLAKAAEPIGGEAFEVVSSLPTKMHPPIPDNMPVPEECMLFETLDSGDYHHAKSLQAILATKDGLVFEFGGIAYDVVLFDGEKDFVTSGLTNGGPIPQHITSRPPSDYWMPVTPERLHVKNIRQIRVGATSATTNSMRALHDFRHDPARKAYTKSDDAPDAPPHARTISR